MDATGIKVPLCKFRNHSLFVDTSKNSATAKCVLAANLCLMMLISLGILLQYLIKTDFELKFTVLIIIIIITIIIIAIISLQSK